MSYLELFPQCDSHMICHYNNDSYAPLTPLPFSSPAPPTAVLFFLLSLYDSWKFLRLDQILM